MSESQRFPDRHFDKDAVARFPWPAVASYPDIHRWMDKGLAVEAAMLVRDAWEGLYQVPRVLAVADRLTRPAAGDRRSAGCWRCF